MKKFLLAIVLAAAACLSSAFVPAPAVAAEDGARINPQLQRFLESKKAGHAPVRLLEYPPWLTRKKGPLEAKGVIYFIRGWNIRPVGNDQFHMLPYMFKRLSEAGWDVIGAQYQKAEGENEIRGYEVAEAAVPFVAQRVADLRGQGYRRIVLAGHSWGAWVALLAESTRKLGVDALLLNSPNVYGAKVFLSGIPNRLFDKNLTEFRGLLRNVDVPTSVMFFSGDDHETGKRGDFAVRQFEEMGVANLVIDEPPGFTDHLAGWLPIFDYAFGGCIAEFLDKPKTHHCFPAPLSDEDFRSIVGIGSIADWDRRTVVSRAALAGKTFAVFPLDDTIRSYSYGGPAGRRHSTAFDSSYQAAEFKNGLECVQDACSRLVRWDDNTILEFDPADGRLKAWWIAIG